jgi:hypothetical protein
MSWKEPSPSGIFPLEHVCASIRKCMRQGAVQSGEPATEIYSSTVAATQRHTSHDQAIQANTAGSASAADTLSLIYTMMNGQE